jgi:hypothetical protein
MEYLRHREVKLRDTNESTNERVKWFAIGTMAVLVALGAWQIVYLRAYFRFTRFNHIGRTQTDVDFQIQASNLGFLNRRLAIINYSTYGVASWVGKDYSAWLIAWPL